MAISREYERQLPIEMKEDSQIISDMDTILNRLAVAKQIVNGDFDKFNLLINGMRQDEQHAHEVIANFNKVFSRILLEAMIRGLNITVQLSSLKTLIGRDKKVQKSLLQIAGIE